MRTTRTFVFAVAAICLAAVSMPARAETWDETLKNTVFDWWEKWKTEARRALLSPVTLNMCWASDKNELVADPAIVTAFQQIPGNEKVAVNFPRDNSGILLGSGEILSQWENGKLNCATVSPDASILGLRSGRWKAVEQTMYASTMVVGVINPEAAELLGKFYHKEPKDLTFIDLVSVAGRKWKDIAPGNAEAANWGIVKGRASDCVRSASCQVVAVALAYSAAGPGRRTGHDTFNPKVKAVIDAFHDKVDHSEGSTGRLTQRCFLNPVDCDFFFTYESHIPDIEKQIPGATIVYNDSVIQADQVVLVTTADSAEREAAIRFIEHIMSAPIQKLIAEKYSFRPATDVRVQGPVQKFMARSLGIVHNPDPFLVKSVLANVSTPPAH